MFKKKNKAILRKKNIVQDYLEAILFAFVVAMVIRNYTFQNFKIPSSSMEETLLIGDYLVAWKMTYFFTDPKREDIVTFRYPADPAEPEPRENFIKLVGPLYWDKENIFFKYHAKKNVVKRVIGLPGEKIEIKDRKVYINDEYFPCPYARFLLDTKIQPKSAGGCEWDGKVMGSRDNFGPITVPKGQYFVMGDNRDVSADSRYWGFLDRHDITGTPSFIFFSKGEAPYKTMREHYFKSMGKKEPGHENIRFDRMFKRIK